MNNKSKTTAIARNPSTSCVEELSLPVSRNVSTSRNEVIVELELMHLLHLWFYYQDFNIRIVIVISAIQIYDTGLFIVHH